MINLRKSKQQGATLIVVLLLLLIMMILALSIASSTTSRTMIANTSVIKAQASQAAETGADVLLTLLNDKQGKVNIPECDQSFANQYHSEDGVQSSITASNDDKRKVSLSWYACKPTDIKKDYCSTIGVTDCFSVVITGVACFKGGDIEDAEKRKSCTVSRHLQGYAVKQ